VRNEEERLDPAKDPLSYLISIAYRLTIKDELACCFPEVSPCSSALALDLGGTRLPLGDFLDLNLRFSR
jgi:hypothetical protein